MPATASRKQKHPGTALEDLIKEGLIEDQPENLKRNSLRTECERGKQHGSPKVPTPNVELEQAIDKRGEDGAFGQDEDQSEGEEQDHDWREPPLLADAQEAPEFAQDGKFSAHRRKSLPTRVFKQGGSSAPRSMAEKHRASERAIHLRIVSRTLRKPQHQRALSNKWFGSDGS
jgi:hypothetical protein